MNIAHRHNNYPRLPRPTPRAFRLEPRHSISNKIACTLSKEISGQSRGAGRGGGGGGEEGEESSGG